MQQQADQHLGLFAVLAGFVFSATIADSPTPVVSNEVPLRITEFYRPPPEFLAICDTARVLLGYFVTIALIVNVILLMLVGEYTTKRGAILFPAVWSGPLSALCDTATVSVAFWLMFTMPLFAIKVWGVGVELLGVVLFVMVFVHMWIKYATGYVRLDAALDDLVRGPRVKDEYETHLLYANATALSAQELEFDMAKDGWVMVD